MEERVKQLENELRELKEYFRTHQHKGYDKSQKLDITTSPGGSDTQVQFNDGGVFGGDADFTWNKTSDTLTLGSDPTITTLTEGNQLIVRTKAATTGTAGTLSMIAGAGAGSGTGGAIDISSGNGGGTSGSGGNIDIQCGGATSGAGATVIISAGDGGAAGKGGDFTISSGAGGATNANAGDIYVTPDAGGGTGRYGHVILGNTTTTTARSGNFVYIPTSAGAPSGTPGSFSGRVAMVYDTTNNDFYIYNSAWKKVTLA